MPTRASRPQRAPAASPLERDAPMPKKKSAAPSTPIRFVSATATTSPTASARRRSRGSRA